MQDYNIFRKKYPLASLSILVACTLVGLLQIVLGEDFTYSLAMYEGALSEGEYYRIFTHAFIHYGIQHFFGNMLCMFFLGKTLERELGSIKFLAIYLAGIVGSALMVEVAGGGYAMHGGASGAIWGLMGATLVYSLRKGFDVRGILRLIIINLLCTFTTTGISWQGHVGGLLAGTLISLLLTMGKGRTVSDWRQDAREAREERKRRFDARGSYSEGNYSAQGSYRTGGNSQIMGNKIFAGSVIIVVAVYILLRLFG